MERLPEAIRDLLSRKPDVLVVGGSQAVHAAKAATSSTPIVMVSIADPAGQGIVASLSRPGGNITGNAILSEVLATKRLELLHEILPKAKRLGFLANPSNPVTPLILNPLRTAALKLGVDVIQFNASNVGELDEALKSIASRRIDGLIISQDVLAYVYGNRIADFLFRNRVPAIHGFSESVLAGGLISYAPSIEEYYRNAARFVARILNGAMSGDLPIEQPTRMEMFVNLKTAKALGITIPSTVLLRADRVIE